MITASELMKINDERRRLRAERLLKRALKTVRNPDATADALHNAAAGIETATQILRLLAYVKAEAQ